MNAPSLAIDHAICGELAASESREWIVANGLGGFASGTVAGTLTRRYHGLLFAARRPPVGRTLLCPKIDADLQYDGETYALATDRWASGSVAPQGYVHVTDFASMERCRYGPSPVLTRSFERRIWMEYDSNYVCELSRRTGPPSMTMPSPAHPSAARQQFRPAEQGI